MRTILPGLIWCLGIAIISKFVAVTLLPEIGAATIAIFLGMIVGNTFGKGDYLKKGTKFSESKLLEISVFLLGATVSFNTLRSLGLHGVGFIICQMSIVIFISIMLGKKLNMTNDFAYLMASGNAVCGSSAIAATAPAIGASEEEKGLAITMVNITGTVLMLLLPFIAGLLYHHETNHTSALIGGVLQSVGQVVASGSMVNNDVKQLSTLYKLVRVILLVVVVILLANLKKHGTTNQEKRKVKTRVPWYVIGFVAACLLYSVGLVPNVISNGCKIISGYLEIIALAGIGMNVNIKKILSQGKKLTLYATIIGISQIVTAVIFIELFLS
ncbi:putative sulfate exporter family transporter [Bacillus sp. RG28]|uniref:Sulfate exporter family transporter n=1 Tax=Gottfriedia endophytica TaxID=2820819 RepID=A0A940NJ07_9BACI|nr:putative sulfate exporter family transporter [Gottfriedia endophytica]MBP0724992.1 putative sulfate exporter family transporter [Gottfriedia endophytica]